MVVPVDEWETICARLDKQAEEETSYLLKSPIMRERLAQARQQKGGKISDEVHRVLGI
ncbi:MAG: prevent-host-death protein [Desulfovibrionales bacterium]|nr:MAG: prevent-host-death protein [Desulfovibrionales bacterium]